MNKHSRLHHIKLIVIVGIAILTTLLIAPYFSVAKGNYILLCYTPTCKEAVDADKYFTSIDSMSIVKLYKKQMADTASTEKTKLYWGVSSYELSIMDSTFHSVYAIGDRDTWNTRSRFSMQLYFGNNGIPTDSLTVLYTGNCILYLDRVIQKLRPIIPACTALRSLEGFRDNLLYDKMCACEEP